MTEQGALHGIVVLVTGAGMGIGAGIARELAAQGATVGIHYAHSEAGVRALAADIARTGGHTAVFPGDLRNAAECAQLVNEAADRFGGRLDAVVNNAGVTSELKFLDTDSATFDGLFGLNIGGYFFCAQQAVRRMGPQGGSILNISSIHGHAGLGNHAAYAATKGAVDAFTRALAVELAPKRIRVNAIAPGFIEVPRYQKIRGYDRLRAGRAVPSGRIGDPADIASLAAFLLSERADYITGQVVYVDGGITARMGFTWPDAADH
jgi:glucose 1-dehydrogenase